jgi:hypothetical protein
LCFNIGGCSQTTNLLADNLVPQPTQPSIDNLCNPNTPSTLDNRITTNINDAQSALSKMPSSRSDSDLPGSSHLWFPQDTSTAMSSDMVSSLTQESELVQLARPLGEDVDISNPRDERNDSLMFYLNSSQMPPPRGRSKSPVSPEGSLCNDASSDAGLDDADYVSSRIASRLKRKMRKKQ